ncbi:hypothetical protein C8035_v003839 [Colletotrichum spinosum]|uniref:Uncharacterized protein n=1 Tax=Colletotrichum spinosum TaxID=1347390 RepID=A0A4R8Q0I7_9PEZI|nr:hypothetical protein C8035_v003839 [Colletotrichum spinosum]
MGGMMDMEGGAEIASYRGEYRFAFFQPGTGVRHLSEKAATTDNSTTTINIPCAMLFLLLSSVPDPDPDSVFTLDQPGYQNQIEVGKGRGAREEPATKRHPEEARHQRRGSNDAPFSKKTPQHEAKTHRPLAGPPSGRSRQGSKADGGWHDDNISFHQPPTHSQQVIQPSGTDKLSSSRPPEAVYIDNTIVLKHKPRRPSTTTRDPQYTLPHSATDAFSTLATEKRVHFAPDVVQQHQPSRTPRSHTLDPNTMCTTDVYTDVYPDGRRDEYQTPNFCSASRNGRLCANPVVYNHPPRSVGYSVPATAYAAPLQSSNAYAYSQIPPSPPMSSPRGPSAEASRPRTSSSSSDRNRRASGIYVNGQRVLDLNRKNRTRAERIVIVDSPPTPRTPPKQFAAPYTAPPSPNTNVETPHFYSHVPRSSLRPVIVDERPRPKVEIEVIDSSHRRHRSSDSRYSHSSAEDSERRRQRRERERRDREERERAEAELRQERIRARIDAQNEKIARRTAVPVPAAPLKRSSTGYANVQLSSERELTDALRRLEVSERLASERRAQEEREQQQMEDEAQRRRLMERMMPRRRATVGPGSRRHRVLYDDGLYRWE